MFTRSSTRALLSRVRAMPILQAKTRSDWIGFTTSTGYETNDGVIMSLSFYRMLSSVLAVLALWACNSQNAPCSPSEMTHSDSGTDSGGIDPQNPKPTIVLVHGAFADASSWSGVIARLEERGYS